MEPQSRPVISRTLLRRIRNSLFLWVFLSPMVIDHRHGIFGWKVWTGNRGGTPQDTAQFLWKFIFKVFNLINPHQSRIIISDASSRSVSSVATQNIGRSLITPCCRVSWPLPINNMKWHVHELRIVKIGLPDLHQQHFHLLSVPS